MIRAGLVSAPAHRGLVNRLLRRWPAAPLINRDGSRPARLRPRHYATWRLRLWRALRLAGVGVLVVECVVVWIGA